MNIFQWNKYYNAILKCGCHETTITLYTKNNVNKTTNAKAEAGGMNIYPNIEFCAYEYSYGGCVHLLFTEINNAMASTKTTIIEKQ